MAPTHLYYLPVCCCAPVCACPPFPTVDTCSLMAFLHLPSLNALWLFSPQHPLPPQGSLPDLDIYLYNKPGGQGTGGKGTVYGTARTGAFPVSWLKGPCPGLQLRGIWGRGRGSLEVPDLSLPVDFYPGVACITLAFVDEEGAPISLASWSPSYPGPPDLTQEEEFEQLTQVTRCSVVPDRFSGGAAWSEEGGSVGAVGTRGTLQ